MSLEMGISIFGGLLFASLVGYLLGYVSGYNRASIDESARYRAGTHGGDAGRYG